MSKRKNQRRPMTVQEWDEAVPRDTIRAKASFEAAARRHPIFRNAPFTSDEWGEAFALAMRGCREGWRGGTEEEFVKYFFNSLRKQLKAVIARRVRPT